MSDTRRRAIGEFIRLLDMSVANATLYSPRHRQVLHLTESALAALFPLLAESPLSLLIIEGEVVADGAPLPAGMYLNRLAQTLGRHGIGHLKLAAGIDGGELAAFIEALAGPVRQGGEIHSSEHLRLGRVEVRHAASEDGGIKRLDLAELPAEERARFQDLCEGVRKCGKLRVTGISEVVQGFVEAFCREADPLMALAPLRAVDEYTFTHSTNVCILNLAQAMALGIEGPLLHDIGIAAMLHDVGKLYVPEEILNKSGALDEQEWSVIKQHPVKGAQYLLDTPGVPRLAVLTAYEHHMRYDLGGYPKVPSNWELNLASQMTMVSDIFDALRTRRAYHDPMEMEGIAAIMRQQSGTGLNPVLTQNFLRLTARLSAADASES
jgi:HD-GYP domain-containing protein (c-di-GMP phosphodiesterase class II)